MKDNRYNPYNKYNLACVTSIKVVFVVYVVKVVLNINALMFVYFNLRAGCGPCGRPRPEWHETCPEWEMKRLPERPALTVVADGS